MALVSNSRAGRVRSKTRTWARTDKSVDEAADAGSCQIKDCSLCWLISCCGSSKCAQAASKVCQASLQLCSVDCDAESMSKKDCQRWSNWKERRGW